VTEFGATECRWSVPSSSSPNRLCLVFRNNSRVNTLRTSWGFGLQSPLKNCSIIGLVHFCPNFSRKNMATDNIKFNWQISSLWIALLLQRWFCWMLEILFFHSEWFIFSETNAMKNIFLKITKKYKNHKLYIEIHIFQKLIIQLDLTWFSRWFSTHKGTQN